MKTENKDEAVRELTKMLETLVRSVAGVQEFAQKELLNHSQRIQTNHEALDGLLRLAHLQNESFNNMRAAVIKLWEDRFGPDAVPPLPFDPPKSRDGVN